MGQEIVNQVQEAQRVPGRIKPRRNTLRHIVIKLTKIKDKYKMLKASREEGQITQGDLSTEMLQGRREWHEIFKVMKGKNLQPRTLYLARLPLRFDREIKSFPDKQKRIQHHQTSFTENAKGTSLGGNTREGKDLQKINPKQL